MTEQMPKPNPICYNCKHAGDKFKLIPDNLTHMHCEHPEYNRKLIESGQMGLGLGICSVI